MSRQSSIQKYNPFEMIVDTTIAGDSGVGNFSILTESGAGYRYNVNWGDGNISASTTDTSLTHTYSVAGIYTIQIEGRFDKFYDFFAGEPAKILAINSWGNIIWKGLDYAFSSASNLTAITVNPPILEKTVSLNATFVSAGNLNPDLSQWDVSKVTSMSTTFNNADSFNNSSLSGWNVSNVTNMFSMFQSNGSFNQDLGAWDVGNCISLREMFRFTTNFNNGGSPSISGWTTSAVTSMEKMFGGTAFNQPIGSWDTSQVTSMDAMFQSCASFNQDVGTWDMSKVWDMNRMFSSCGSFNNGGYGSISGWTFSTGTSVNMGVMFAYSPFNQDIGAWDMSNVTSVGQMFQSNTSFNNGGSPSISGWTFNSGLTSMSAMFRGATAFNQDISSWVVTGVTNMATMFMDADAFDQDLGNWDVSKVMFMNSMFRDTELTGFNNGGSPSISGWTTSAVTDMNYMFEDNKTFNQPIGSWDTSNVVSLAGMFSDADAFAQDIGAWDVGKVESLNSTFANTTFNNGGSPSISGWTTSANTSLYSTFYINTGFNQPIGSWDTSQVTTMSSMFQQANSFNQDIGAWDVSGVVGDANNFQAFAWMFNGATSFNNGGSPSISGWTFNNGVSDGITMEDMFIGCSSFNQPLDGWNLSAVTSMQGMLWGASVFDQDIGMWDVRNVTKMSNMLNGTSLSNTNYDKLLTGWTGWVGTGATNTLKTNVVFHAGGAKYSSGTTAELARDYLTDATTGLSWTITDGGGI